MDHRLVRDLGNSNIRRFGVDSIQRQVDNVLSALPEESHGAILDVDLGPDGVRAVLAAKLDDRWSIGLIGEKSRRDWGVGTRVVYTW